MRTRPRKASKSLSQGCKAPLAKEEGLLCICEKECLCACGERSDMHMVSLVIVQKCVKYLVTVGK